MGPSTLSAYELYATGEGFFDPGQADLTAPYVPRYFAEVGERRSSAHGWALRRCRQHGLSLVRRRP